MTSFFIFLLHTVNLDPGTVSGYLSLHIPCTPSFIPTIQLGQNVYYLSLVSSVSQYIISEIQLYIERADIIDTELCAQFLDSNVRGVVNTE
jgi:hypothetical protein